MKSLWIAVCVAAGIAALGVSANAQSSGLEPPYATCLVSTATATICSGSTFGVVRAHQFVAVANVALTAQTVTLTLYDNNTGACSGPIAASIAALGANAMLTWPPPGRFVTNGLTACASGTPVAPGIEVYAR